MHTKFYKLHLIFLSLFSSLISFSQKPNQQAEAAKAKILADKNVSEVQISKERSSPSLIFFDLKKSGYATGETPALLRNYLSLRPGYDDMLPVKQTKAYNDFVVPEFQQYFKGVKVEYSRYKSLAKNNRVMMLAGSFYQVPVTLSVTPKISESHALELAKKQVGAKHYVYEDLQQALAAATDVRIKNALSAELKEVFPKGELVIVKDFTNKGATEMRLAYKFNLYASEPLSRGYIFVDAETGKILLYNAIIKHASVPTNVTTRYAGMRTIGVKLISGNDPNSGLPLTSSHPTTEAYVPGTPTYVLIDDTKGKGIETYDLNGVGGLPVNVPGIYGLGKSFTDVDNNWTLAEHKRGPGEEGANEAENDDIAWDAHWGASMVYDYWKQKQGRLSYDNDDAAIKSYIHYGPAYDNAFWNGTAMTYGDGSGEAAAGFKPLTSLDVCGHEIGHGVCSFTSDLVYEKESGAMNEALSDIWAASIEYFAIKHVDPSLQSIYKPFYIGEQISATPLRRMDDPKLSGNPDTYDGDNWSDPDCIPNLANDQCGVHNNSGLLNKWFYLVTLGSGAGSGPDADFAVAGVDDGVNDNNDTYSVTGLGFDVSERITYLTEMLLSSTATYAEFRDVAISVAKAYSGDPCGEIVETVTNGMYAIGVGDEFDASCTTTFGFVLQPGMSAGENNGEVGCTASGTIYVPILLPANSTATMSFGGTATMGQDYTASATSLSNAGAGNKQDTLAIAVKNDAVIEGNETIVITITGLNGSSNASFTITISDDDVAPRIGKEAITLLDENFDGYAEGFDQPSTWTEVLEIPDPGGADPLRNGQNQWGIFSDKLAIAPKTNIVLPIPLPTTGGTYLPTSTSQTRITASKIDARGLSNIQLKFDYNVQGEVDPNGVDPEQFGKFDYMAVIYSLDGTTYSELGQGYYFAALLPTSGTFNDTLPAFLNNQEFYIGFRWLNDANAGGPNSITIDNLSLKGSPRMIESEMGNSSSETQGPNQEVYFYSKEDGEIIAKVDNAAVSDYGCMTATIVRAGNGTFVLYTDAEGSHKVSDKYIQLTPATNQANGQYTISLYYTEEEIAAIETSTGTTRDNFYLYKSSGASADDATGENTVRTPAVYTAITGAGGIFTATFSTGFSGFALGVAVVPLPVTCLELKAVKAGNNAVLNWKVASEVNNKLFEVEKSTNGTTFTHLASINSDSRNSGSYSYQDKNAAASGNVYYRLKQVDASGAFRYICNTVSVAFAKAGMTFGNLFPNPVKGKASIKVNSDYNSKLQIEVMNSIGQVVHVYTENVSAGNNTLSIKLAGASAGNYMLRFKDDSGKVLNTQALSVK